MRLTHGTFQRTDVWREGKWLDLWSVVHFLTGVSTAFGLFLSDFGTAASIVIALLAFTAYEFWEAIVKIEETPQNRFMDVVVGMVSFIPTFILLERVPEQYLILSFGGVLTVNVVLAGIGWMASRKADELERRLRIEFAEKQKHLRQRRARFVARMKRGAHIIDK